VTLFGFGIKISVDRGHLILEDGIGTERHRWRFSRVGHGLRRLVVIGADGFISLAALRWVADQDAAFVMLERDGTVLASTGPAYGLDDARLRRAQAAALHSGAGLLIARELISKKLAGQEQVARDKLHSSEAANAIAHFRNAVGSARTIDAIRLLESQAATEYWSGWQSLSITFPKSDVRLIPEHWRTFAARRSPLSGSSRLAVTPVNAIVNYLYSLLEAEACLAAAAMGLDPGLGILHLDTKARASLACDLMEPVRPDVDAFVLDWINRALLKREWFFEKRDGNCRLMAPFAAQLSETAPVWRRAVAPFAEWVARTLWSTIRKSDREPAPATRLTQRHKREVTGAKLLLPPAVRAPRPQNICHGCGAPITPGCTHCAKCKVPIVTGHLISAAISGRVASKSAKSRARLADTQSRHNAERRNWEPSSQPAWLDEETYRHQIQPRLESVTRSAIARALGVSGVYAGDIRRGERLPHPRHWQALAKLAGLLPGG
jgi:CRISPR-associated endonuclease Cas1